MQPAVLKQINWQDQRLGSKFYFVPGLMKSAVILNVYCDSWCYHACKPMAAVLIITQMLMDQTRIVRNIIVIMMETKKHREYYKFDYYFCLSLLPHKLLFSIRKKNAVRLHKKIFVKSLWNIFITQLSFHGSDLLRYGYTIIKKSVYSAFFFTAIFF